MKVLKIGDMMLIDANRRVQVFEFEKESHPLVKPRPKRPIHKGTFLGWAQNYEEFEAGPGNYTMAIVEKDDGHVVLVWPELIQFIEDDNPTA